MRKSGVVFILFALSVLARAAIIEEGVKALDAGQPDDAIAVFTEILKSEPRNAQAHHGIALAHLLRADNAKACSAADQAMLIAQKPDRTLVINAAAAHFAMKNYARAARILKDYLAANPKSLDEPVLNALGTTLSKMTAKDKQNRIFAECTAFYEQVNKRFEAARPGHRRFGADWFTAKDYATLEAAHARHQKELDRLTTAINLAEEQIARHQAEIARQQDLLRRGDGSARYYLRQAEQQLLTAQTSLSTAQQKYEDYSANIDKPEFPETIATVSMSATTVSEFSAVQTLGTPDPTVGVTPGGKRVRKAPVDLNPAGAATVKGQITPATQPARKLGYHAVGFAVTHNLLVTTSTGLDDQSELKVVFNDGTSVLAQLVRKDDTSGMALIRIAAGRMSCLPIADAFEPGAVFCVTYPDATGRPRVVTGKAAAPGAGEWTVGVASHAKIAGSPLLGEQGKVVGMCIAGGDARNAAAVTLAQIKALVGNDNAKARPLEPGQDMAGAVAQIQVTR
jgi:hypothetical protein